MRVISEYFLKLKTGEYDFKDEVVEGSTGFSISTLLNLIEVS